MPMHSLRTKLIVFWVSFAALLVGMTNVVAFRTALDAQFQQLRQTLIAIARTAALSIDGDLHEQIPPDPASANLRVYHALVEQLRSIRNTNPAIRYVYTMKPSPIPGKWYYVVDAEERKTSLPGELYDVTRYPAMAAGLQGPNADPTITIDEWGPLLSGYAPIRNREGNTIAILGIDMSGEQVARTQVALRRWAMVVLAIGLVAVCSLGFLIAQWISKPIQALVRGTQRIGQGDFDYRVPVQSRDEVGLLAQAFNRMAELLSGSLKQLQTHVLSTIESLSLALEAKDRYTRGHSERVHHYAIKIAHQMQLPADQVDVISKVTRLHDIGKIGIKEEILTKPGKLTPDEFQEIKHHPDVGYRILAPLKLPKDALDIVRHHHEWSSGEGYPSGLRQDQIPLPVAVVSVADAFDAMTGHRPYRPTSLTFPEAVEELRRYSGRQFRQDAVEALVEVLRQEGKLPSP